MFIPLRTFTCSYEFYTFFCCMADHHLPQQCLPALEFHLHIGFNLSYFVDVRLNIQPKAPATEGPSAEFIVDDAYDDPRGHSSYLSPRIRSVTT